MRRLVTLIVAAVGGIGLLLGLLFVIGSAGQARRLVVGGIFLGSGAGLLGIAIRRFRFDTANSPERVRALILDLAKREDGEISREEVAAMSGGQTPTALRVLDELAAEGVCRRAERKGSTFFIFPHLQPRLTVLRCEYCATEQALNSGLDACPRCGGPLAQHVVARSLAEGDVFSMDEETPS